MTGPGAKYLLFSVDTEPDDPEWRGLHRGGWTHHNLRGLPRLAALLRRLGAKATFFATHSVALRPETAAALEPLLKEGLAEVGTHLHPGDTPPFGPFDAASGDNLLRLPPDILAEKLASLHGELARRFGAPVSYRSAAWALDARVATLLPPLGYRADSSVTPGVSWRRNGRPCYLGAPAGCYRLGAGDPSVPGEGPLVEVPVSIWSRRRLDPASFVGRRLGDLLTMPLAVRKGAAARLVKALRPPAPRWLRPALEDEAGLREVAGGLAGEDQLHVMCHSNELWPAASPYVKTPEELDAYYARLEGILRLALDRGYVPVTVGERAARLAGGSPRR